MKRALVTGGCGFIGSNLVKELVNQGWLVDVIDDMSNGHLELLDGVSIDRVILSGMLLLYKHQIDQGNRSRDKNSVLVVQGDFASPEILQYIKDKNYDTIFHQAAVPRVSYSVEHPTETTNTNITKTVALFEAAANNVKRIVFASSSSVYGGADILPTTEAAIKKPKSPYAWQKSAIEDYAAMCYDLYDLDVVCLRYFNVFGPGQYGDSPYSTAVSAWCNSIKNDIECRSDGDGTQTRDMCYVDNVVSANILAANSSKVFKGNYYNIACGDRVSNNDILEYFKIKHDAKVRNSPWRPGDVMHTMADITKAKEDFGYEPKVLFWEGLKKTIQWWKLK